MRRWTLAVLAVAVCATACEPAVAAGKARITIVKLLSRADLFPGGCAGQVFPGADFEPHIAVDSVLQRRMAVAWIDGSGITNVLAFTRDGGRHWRERRVPGLDCTGDDGVALTGDPWLSYGRDGILYMSSATDTGSDDPQTNNFRHVKVMVNRSRSGGKRWSDAIQVEDSTFFNDKPGITADPQRGRRVYATWTRGTNPTFSQGEVMVARSGNRGRTWSQPSVAVDPPTTSIFPWGSTIRVLPDGTLLDTVMQWHTQDLTVPTSGTWEAVAARSTDRGRTWSTPAQIAQVPVPFVADPDSLRRIRSTPHISLDTAHRGTAYVAWHQRGGDGVSEVVVARSEEGGLTWSEPVVVDGATHRAFLPEVAVARNGVVGVTYFDLRADRAGDSELTSELWFAWSTDRGQTWRERRLSGPFDYGSAVEVPARSLFLGDYFGLAGLRRGFAAAWAEPSPSSKLGPSDIFFARLRVRRPRIGR